MEIALRIAGIWASQALGGDSKTLDATHNYWDSIAWLPCNSL